MSQPAIPPLSLTTKVTYGVGSFGLGIVGTVLSGGVLQLYFNQVLGLPAVWVGAAIMISIVIDAVIDPLIGLWSDRLRAPFGRRHTLMYASAVPTALAFWLIWHSPQGLSQPLLLAFVVASMLFARIASSFYEIPSISLAPELASDTHERTSLLAWRWFFAIAGLGASILVMYQVFLRQDAGNPLGVLNRERYAQFGTLAAVLVGVIMILSTAATHSRIKYLHIPPAEPLNLRRALGDCRAVLTDRSLVLMMAAGLLTGIAQGTGDGLSAYENLHFWGLPPQVIGYVVGGAAVAAFIALPLAQPLSKAMGKRRSLMTLYFIWLVTVSAPPALRFMGAFPANGSPALLPTLVANFVVGATCALTAIIILGSMLTDAVDAVATRTGLRSEGLTFAVFGVLNKWAVGAGAFVAGAIITLVKFPGAAVPGTVAPAIVNNMVLLHVPAAVALNIVAMWLLSRVDVTPPPAASATPESLAKAA